MKNLLLALVAVFFASNAQAQQVWNYRMEPASMIKGGKLKIYDAGNGKGFKKLALKYKLQTSFGYKESTVSYNFPSKVLDPDFLASLKPGQTVDLGVVPHGWKKRVEKFTITRESQSAYLVSSGDGQFRIFPRNNGGAWKRVEFTVRGTVTVRLNGNLESVDDE